MRKISHLISILGLFIIIVITLTSGPISAQNITREIQKIQDGQKINASVIIYGVVDRWNINKANNTISYVIVDDWGDKITIIATGEHPKTHKRYKVSGYVSYDQANREYQVMQTARESVSPSAAEPAPTQTYTPPPVQQQSSNENVIIIILIIAVLAVIGGLIFVVVKSRSTPPGGTDFTSDFSDGAVVTIADKTQKITAAVADQKAVEMGTVKVMPGRFEVQGGVDLKEIRLIRPKGVPDHSLQYTFGRLSGDKITHIQLNDSTVSSKQAYLRYKNGKYALVNIPDPDDPDRNATTLNNNKMGANESLELNDKDVIQMGYVTLVYHVR